MGYFDQFEEVVDYQEPAQQTVQQPIQQPIQQAQPKVQQPVQTQSVPVQNDNYFNQFEETVEQQSTKDPQVIVTDDLGNNVYTGNVGLKFDAHKNPFMNLWRTMKPAVKSFNPVEMVKGLATSAKNNLTLSGLAGTPGAVARGVIKGGLDLPSNLWNLGTDLYYGAQGKVNEHQAFKPGTALYNFIDEQNDKIKDTNPVVYNILNNLSGGNKDAEFAEMTGEFLAPTKGATGILGKANKLKEANTINNIAKSEKARILGKLTEEQAAKYGKSVDKLAQKNARNIYENTPQKTDSLLTKGIKNSAMGGTIGFTQGNDLQERTQNALGGLALGAGGTALEGIGGKVAKTKTAQNIKQNVQDVVNNSEQLSSIQGTIDSVLNRESNGENVQKYKDLNNIVSKTPDIKNNITRLQESNLEKMKGLSQEANSELLQRLKHGDREYANRQTKAKGYELKDKLNKGEEVSSSDVAFQEAQELSADIEQAEAKQKLKNELEQEKQEQEQNRILKEEELSESQRETLRQLKEAGIITDEAVIEELSLPKYNEKDFKITRLENSEAIGSDTKIARNNPANISAKERRNRNVSSGQEEYEYTKNYRNRIQEKLEAKFAKKNDALKNAVFIDQETRKPLSVSTVVEPKSGKIRNEFMVTRTGVNGIKDAYFVRRRTIEELNKQNSDRKLQANRQEADKYAFEEEYSNQDLIERFKEEQREQTEKQYTDELNNKDSYEEYKTLDEENKVDNVNKDYIGSGFHEVNIDEVNQRYKDASSMYGENRTKEIKFQEFYDKNKKSLSKDSLKSRKIIKDYLNRAENIEEKNWIIDRLAEQTGRDLERFRPKSNKDSYAKYRREQKTETNILKNTTDAYNESITEQGKIKSEYNASNKEITNANNLFRKAVQNEKYKMYKDAGIKDKAKKANKYKAENPVDSIREISKARPEQAQSMYDNIADAIYNSKNGEGTRKYAIEQLNKAVKEAGLDLDTKSFPEISKRAYNMEQIGKLESVLKDENLSEAQKLKEIIKIQRENEHGLYKTSRLTSAQKDVISESYALEAKSFLDKTRRVKQMVQEEAKRLEDKGYTVHLEQIEAKIVRDLKSEYEKMSRIIEKTYSDWSKNEATKLVEKHAPGTENRYKLEGRGETFDRMEARQSEWENVKLEIEKNLGDSNARTVNKYWREGSSDRIINNDAAIKEIENKIRETLKKGMTRENLAEVEKLNKRRLELEEENGKFIEGKEAGYDLDKIESDIKDLKEKTREIPFDSDGIREFGNNIQELNALESFNAKIKNKNYVESRQETNVYGNAKALIEKGNKITKEEFNNHIKLVKDGEHNTFIKGAMKYVKDKAGFEKVLYAIKSFANSHLHQGLDNISNIGKQILKNTGIEESKILTTYKPKDLLYHFLNDDKLISEIPLKEMIDSIGEESFAVLDASAFKTKGRGLTAKNGKLSAVKFENPQQFIQTTVHELVHNAIRANRNNPEFLKKFGITEKDLIDNENASVEFRNYFDNRPKDELKNIIKFIEENNGRNIYEAARIEAFKNGDIYGIKLKDFEKGCQLIYDKKFKNIEENLANSIADKILEVYNDGQRFNESIRTNDRHSLGLSRDGENISNGRQNVQENVREEQQVGGERQRQINSSPIVQKVQSLLREGKTEKEIWDSLSEQETKDYLDAINKTQNAVIEEIPVGLSEFKKKPTTFKEKKQQREKQNTPEENIRNLKVSYKDMKSATRKEIREAEQAYRELNDSIENYYVETGIATKAQLKNRILQQSKDSAGEGAYIANGFGQATPFMETVAKPKKEGFFFKKTKDGTSNKTRIDEAYYNRLRTWANQKHANDVVDFISKNFDKKNTNIGTSEGYVDVNSNVLRAAISEGKSNAWVDTLMKGDKAIEKVFTPEEAKVYKEFLGRKNNRNKDLRIPKQVYDMILDGRNEKVFDYWKNYGKTHTTSAIGRTVGTVVDILNNQFKRGVLSTSTFFTNNRIGNQMMMAGKASSPVDYIKGIVHAYSKDSKAVPTKVLESTLLEACKQADNPTRKWGNVAFDNTTNLLNGHLIDVKDLPPIQKGIATTGNILIGAPNRVYRAISNGLMRLNENFERLERKQAYFQELSRMQREDVKRTAQGMITTENLIKQIKDNPELEASVINRIEDILGDYDNFNKVERNVLKRLIPFYSWHRTITRHVTTMLKDNPTKVALIYYGLNRAKAKDEDLVDWQKGSIRLPLYDTRTGKQIFINKVNVVPYETITENMSIVPNALQGNFDGAWQNVTPVIKTPLEAMVGKKFFSGSPEFNDKKYMPSVKKGRKGYVDKDGNFYDKLPNDVRLRYVGKQLIFDSIYPANKSIVKGVPSAIMHKIETGEYLLPDKMYDTSNGGFYDGEAFNNKKKRNAKGKMSFKNQVINRAFGLSLQSKRDK